MKVLMTIYFSTLCMICQAQSTDKLIVQGDYSSQDSIKITRVYLNSKQAIDHMYNAMNAIWIVEPQENQSKKSVRIIRWANDAAFTKWLGKPEKIRMACRRIKKIHSKYDKKIFLKVFKENKGRCKGWISAWTMPFGKVKIRLCVNYLKYRTYLHEKTLIHELGHEAGMLFHKNIQDCWRAQRAAGSTKSNVAKRSPENYAWLAMSYLGLECSY